jgi:hypothetical protein
MKTLSGTIGAAFGAGLALFFTGRFVLDGPLQPYYYWGGLLLVGLACAASVYLYQRRRP